MLHCFSNTISDAGSDDEDDLTLPKKGSRLGNIFSKKCSNVKRASTGGMVEPPQESQVVIRKKNLSESDVPQSAYMSSLVHPKSNPDMSYSDVSEWPLRKKRTDSMNNYLDMTDYRDRRHKKEPTMSPVTEDNGTKEETEESEFLKMVKAANPVDIRSNQIEEAAPSMMARSFSKQYSHVQRHSSPDDPGATSNLARSVSRQAASCGYTTSSELKRCGSDSSLNNFYMDDEDDDNALDEEEETEDDVFKSDPSAAVKPQQEDAKDEYFQQSLPPMTELKGFDLSNHTRYSLQPLMETSESVSSESQEESHQGSRGSSQRGSANVPSRQGSQGSVVSANGATPAVSSPGVEDDTNNVLLDFPPIPELPNPRQELTWGSSSDQIREFIAKNRGPRELYLPPKTDELSGKAVDNLKVFLETLESDT